MAGFVARLFLNAFGRNVDDVARVTISAVKKVGTGTDDVVKTVKNGASVWTDTADVARKQAKYDAYKAFQQLDSEAIKLIEAKGDLQRALRCDSYEDMMKTIKQQLNQFASRDEVVKAGGKPSNKLDTYRTFKAYDSSTMEALSDFQKKMGLSSLEEALAALGTPNYQKYSGNATLKKSLVLPPQTLVKQLEVPVNKSGIKKLTDPILESKKTKVDIDKFAIDKAKIQDFEITKSTSSEVKNKNVKMDIEIQDTGKLIKLLRMYEEQPFAEAILRKIYSGKI